MTKLKDVLAAADPLRDERRPSADAWAAMRRDIVAAGATHTPTRARYLIRPLLAAAFATLVICAAVGSAWLRGGTIAQAAVRFEIRLAEDQPDAGLQRAQVAHTNRFVYLHQDVVVTNADIEASSVVPGDATTRFWIDVKMNSTGADKLQRATANHVGRPIAILIDGEVVAAPTVKSPIGAAAVISGDFTREDAERIAIGMRPNQ